VLLAAAALFAVTAAHADVSPSFNCNKATTADEVTICQSQGLTFADLELSRIFSQLRDQMSGRQRQQFVAEQATWLGHRMECGVDAACIGDAYDKRMAEVSRYCGQGYRCNSADPTNDQPSHGECSGILPRDQGSLSFGGEQGEGEGTCMIADTETAKVLARCSPRHFCRVKGISLLCPNSGECGLMTYVISASRK
jgi:uncharacterized protein YecT (DUF1311 family)